MVFSLALAALSFSAVSLAQDVDESAVTVLTSSNFDSFIQGDTVLVEFYAPWCGHCKRLTPEYAKAAKRLAKDDPPVPLGKVDATEEGELAQRFGVTGYPTLKVFRNGEASDYGGPRDESGIVKYMRGQAGPAAKPLKEGAELEKFLQFDEDVSFVGYFTSADSAAASAFTKAASAKRDDFRFGIVTDAAQEKVVCHRPASWKGEEPTVTMEGAVTLDALKSFFMSASLPLAGEFSADTAARYGAAGKPRLTVYANVDKERDPSGYRYIVNRLRKAAQNGDVAGALTFAVASRVSGPGAAEATAFGFGEDVKFGMGVVDARGNKYKRAAGADENKLSPADIVTFAQEYLAGKVDIHVKSEDIPAPAKEGEEVVLVGKTFNELAMESEEDYFIEFYAPWCGHCKSLAPKWEQLAKKVNVEGSKVKVAKIDATANDGFQANFEVSGFPTIYLAKAGSKDAPIKYDGARETKDMLKWLRANAKHGDTIPKGKGGKKGGKKDEL